MVDFLDLVVESSYVDIPRHNIHFSGLRLPLRISHYLDPDRYSLCLGDTFLLSDTSEESIKKE